ncbi:MAG: DUF1080 domain-containing protein [Candidatus Hydrogenedens sp.]|jgi:hypothetical protein|nr:DUF1080 domain-containing protein [Candidatus Hydrogenedens sp.]
MNYLKLSVSLFVLTLFCACAAMSDAVEADPELEEGYVSLFNGKNLDGWIGDTKGYIVKDGLMICKPGGNVFTEKEYSDFSFRFEFKLTPGANNGVGIRAPLEGNPSYTGMEIQILDDRHPKYAELHDWQAHGSIYGIVSAKRDHLKPVGEWNEEEIIAKGRQITVILNGETIVDADLDEATKDGTLDGQDHPGVARSSGHLGFLGHGDVLEFRNLRIKELTD